MKVIKRDGHMVDWCPEKVEAAIDIIKEYSSKRTEIVPSTASYDIGRYASFPVEVTVGGATIFVLDVAQFLKV